MRGSKNDPSQRLRENRAKMGRWAGFYIVEFMMLLTIALTVITIYSHNHVSVKAGEVIVVSAGGGFFFLLLLCMFGSFTWLQRRQKLDYQKWIETFEMRDMDG